jgi:hypothetical protein
MPTCSDDVELNVFKVECERVRKELRTYVDPAIFRGMRLEKSRDFMRDHVIYAMVRDFVGSVEGVAIVRCPRTPWQHFKKSFFPRWLLSIFPVTYQTEEIVTYRLCPHRHLPDSHSKHLEFLANLEAYHDA